MNFNKIREISYALFEKNPNNIRCNHFSFAIYKNRILSIARNSWKSHPENRRNPKVSDSGKRITDTKMSCSEFLLLKKLKYTTNISFDKIVMVNTRINRNGKLALSKPCNSCASLIEWAEVKSVYYTDDGGEFIRYK